MLEGLAPAKRTYDCRIALIRKDLSDSDRKIFDEALADTETWSAYSLSVALTNRGIKIQDKPIRKHRSGLCQCSKT